MNYEVFAHKNIQPDGKADVGSVEVKPIVRFGHGWVTITTGLMGNGTVTGVRFSFDDAQEQAEFIRTNDLEPFE